MPRRSSVWRFLARWPRAPERAHFKVRERGAQRANAARERQADERSGEGGIRTHEVFRLSAFQERRHQPLGHLSGGQDTSGAEAFDLREPPTASG